MGTNHQFFMAEAVEQQLQTEDSAVEELNTTTENKSYEMDKQFIQVQIKIGASKKPYTHIFRKPTFDEEEAREKKMPLVSSDLGKIEGEDASSMSLDDEPANVYLYDKILLAVKGYAMKPGEKASDEEISADSEIDSVLGKKTVRELIPSSHKATAILGMFPSKFEVEVGEDGEEDFTFALGGGREWTVKQEIGGRVKQEDGSLSKPNFEIRYTFREPTESERKKFRTQAFSAIMTRDPKTGTTKERRSTMLRVIRDLFDNLIVSIEGATVGGKEINVAQKEALALIPSDFKKGSVIRLFNFLEADLGN
jgi:hypothetical protein